MGEKQNLLEYSGKLAYGDISGIAQKLKQRMDELNESVGVYKKLLTIIVESLENILKYTEKLGDHSIIFNTYPATFQLVKYSNCYFVKASNPIRNADIQRLKTYIENINVLNKKDIKNLYNTTIANGVFSEQGGAGLGMLEIIKAADNKIGYTFAELNQEYSYFSINVELKSC
jgi:hypothetical protein